MKSKFCYFVPTRKRHYYYCFYWNSICNGIIIIVDGQLGALGE